MRQTPRRRRRLHRPCCTRGRRAGKPLHVCGSCRPSAAGTVFCRHYCANRDKSFINCTSRPGGSKVAVVLAGIALLCLLAYGVVVGAFSGGTQLWAAPLKIAGGAPVDGSDLPAEPLRARLSGGRTRQAQAGPPRGPLAGHGRAQCDPPGQLRADRLGFFAVNRFGRLHQLSAPAAVGHRVLFWSAAGAHRGAVFGRGRSGLPAGCGSSS